MTTTTGGQLNQVDLSAVGALVEKIKQRPSAAQTTWSAEVRWTGAFRSEATVRTFAPTASDEPKGMGGSDSAPNPVEQLLGSLGNCLAVGYAANASVAGIAIRELRGGPGPADRPGPRPDLTVFRRHHRQGPRPARLPGTRRRASGILRHPGGRPSGHRRR